MTKNLKLNVKNKQIAGAINLRGLKDKLAKKKPEEDVVSVSEEKLIPEVEGQVAKKKKKPSVEKELSKEVQVKKTTKKSLVKDEVESKEAEASIAKEALVSKEIKKENIVKKEEEKISQLAEKENFVKQPIESYVSEEKVVLAPHLKVEPVHPIPVETKKTKEDRKPEIRQQEVRQESKSAYTQPPRQPQQGGGGRPYQQRTDQQRSDRPYQQHQPGNRPSGGGDRPYQQRPSGDRPYQSRPPGDRPYQPRPSGDRPSGDRPYQQRPSGDRPSGDRPYQPRPAGDRPYQPRPPGDRPYQSRPPGDRPYQPRPGGDRAGGERTGQDRPYQHRGPSSGSQASGYQGGAPYRRPAGSAPYTSSRPSTGLPGGGAGAGVRKGPPPIFEETKSGPRREFKQDNSRFKGNKQKEDEASRTIKRGDEKTFDARARHGAFEEDEGGVWRRKKQKAVQIFKAPEIVRPSKIKVCLPITVKDLAVEMKLKASELISKLFIQGIIVTLNDLLLDSVVVQLLGQEFGCEIIIDTKEEERIRISDKNVKQEISEEDSKNCKKRSPVIAFMGHVDHGKTSLIDAIRKTNRAAKEVGAITQHIGAFRCKTEHGDITVLDTPGHEAFTLMRERGAGVTDIVVLVVAGDEGIKEQTVEAIKQAKSANATIVVAITKSDKPNFSKDLVFRQLSDQELLPESWGGTTVTIACSAVTNEGIEELLEMLAIQSDVLELKANPSKRARGAVIESEMQLGLGATTTLLVQNGTLNIGDAIVFGSEWAKVKSMRDEYGMDVNHAIPSTPVRITGLSGLPDAGEEFIVVKSEKEAREIAESRMEGRRQTGFQLKKRLSMESLIETQKKVKKKVLTLILRADVQGSLEALTKALEKILSDKAEVNIISQGVGQISESDVQLAYASEAVILGFHTGIEAHAEPLIKQLGVKVILHEIIYHAVDNIKDLMKALLDKLEEEVQKGKAEVRALFQASQIGTIAGCMVTDGSITRSYKVRLKRGGDIIFKGPISSLKRFKEDVKEVGKNMECGILLQGFTSMQIGDILEAFEINYITQDL